MWFAVAYKCYRTIADGWYSHFVVKGEDVFFYGADTESLFRPYIDPGCQCIRYDKCSVNEKNALGF